MKIPAVLKKHWVPVFLLLLTLLYVWSSTWFVTTDGPCHAYNAMVLGKLISGDINFTEHLHVFWFPSPNWIGHILMVFLEQMFAVNIAEKMAFSIYAVVYIIGYYQLGKQWLVSANLLVSLMTLLIFPAVFIAGFFNNQLGYALIPWLLMAFQRAKQTPTLKQLLVLTLITLLLYFTHPVPYLIAMMILGLWTVFENQWWSERKSIRLFLALFPSVLLMLIYLLSAPGASFQSVESFKTLAFRMLEFDALTNYDSTRERPVNIALAILLLSMFFLTLRSLMAKRFSAFQRSLVVVFSFWVIIHLVQPAGFAGAGILSFRTQYIPYYLITLLIPTIQWPQRIERAVVGICIVGFMLMLNIRLPHKAMASRAVEEMVTTRSYMQSGDVAIGLDCNHNGFLNGRTIAKSAWLFTHVADYLNAETEQVSLVNYESVLFHFPVHWNKPFFPYSELSCNEGIEHIPPCLKLMGVEDKLGLKIDHVFLVFANKEVLRDHVNYKTTVQNISEAGFHLVYTSANGVVELYSR
ncbi:MAG: hypothetical protein R2813_11325 [Flavobacteriales bacterium]